MNAARVGLAAGLAFAVAQAAAQPPRPTHPHPHPHPPVIVPQPSAPSSSPDDSHRHIPRARYAVEDLGDEYEASDACMARRATDETSIANAGTDTTVIDWCAVPAFEPRYAPQIPASWWWRRNHWPEWRPW
jgi:hypothetical protein